MTEFTILLFHGTCVLACVLVLHHNQPPQIDWYASYNCLFYSISKWWKNGHALYPEYKVTSINVCSENKDVMCAVTEDTGNQNQVTGWHFVTMIHWSAKHCSSKFFKGLVGKSVVSFLCKISFAEEVIVKLQFIHCKCINLVLESLHSVSLTLF